VAQPKQPKLHPHHVSKVDLRRQNMVGRQNENWERSRVLGRAGQSKIRHRDLTGNLSVNGSAHGRLPPLVNTGNVAEVRRLEFVNRTLRQVVQDLRMKRGRKKERRVSTVSRHHNELARLPEPSTARDRDNPKVERESPKKEHRHQDHNSLREIIPSGSG